MPYPCEVKSYRMDWEDGDFYVGSTKQPRLSQRMTVHREKCKIGRTSKIYNKMREFGLHSFKYVILGSKIVNNYEEQRQYEQEFINDLRPSLNMIKAYLTPEEKEEYDKNWRQEHREERKKTAKNWKLKNPEYEKNWRQEHREERNEYMKKYYRKTKNTWLCKVCDQYYSCKGNLTRHKKSKNHLARV